MADAGATWSRNSSNISVDPNEKLFLFGYSCKIFRDDEKSRYIDQGRHLIPWMGDPSLMIDRYDVRGYLHDLKQYEPDPDGYDDPLADEESLCDEERYRSLRSDMSEEQLYQEEELKRLRAAVACDGAYHEIGFTYDNAENEKYVAPQPKVEEPEDELYQIPEGLVIPKGMEMPYTMKIHAIIQKTALFVSEQGGQMEIIIKMKQQANPQFAFMHLDNPLYPYYKHLVKEIKSGAYKPLQVKRVSHSEDEDDDGHYLHPSLMSGRQEPVPKFTVPNINFRRSSDDSYSVLVRNLQQKRVTEESNVESPSLQSPEHVSQEASENVPVMNYSYDENHQYESNELSASQLCIVPPPPDLQPIIDKMAEYVVKNGEDFEIIVKSKNDSRFDFLHTWHEYYSYYIYKREGVKSQLYAESSNINNNEQSDTPENTSHLQAEVNHAETENAVVHESGPVMYSNMQPDQSVIDKKNDQSTVIDEFDALHTQDSQDSIFNTIPTNQEVSKEETSDSLDCDSPAVSRSPKEERKKPMKVLKGPISFSLKAKDTDTPTDKTKLTTLLLDDDSECDSTEDISAEKEDSAKKRKTSEDSIVHPQSKSYSIEEAKPSKPSNEFLEAKQAEERIKDKLLAAARERLAQQRKEKQLQQEQQKREEQLKKEKQQLLDQQRKEKQLQLERKRKAELFLKMLKKKNPDPSAVVSHILASDKSSSSQQNTDFWRLPDASNITHSDSRILFSSSKLHLSSHNYSAPGIKADWSSNSNSEQSGEEEPISVIGEKLSEPETVEKPQSPTKIEKKGKKKKRSRSRSSKGKTSRRNNRHRSKSRSPSRSFKPEKSKREKQLPAAYALSTRSRSRSRSPRRYRSSFNHWSRRR